jgi:hypothetical protein
VSGVSWGPLDVESGNLLEDQASDQPSASGAGGKPSTSRVGGFFSAAARHLRPSSHSTDRLDDELSTDELRAQLDDCACARASQLWHSCSLLSTAL